MTHVAHPRRRAILTLSVLVTLTIAAALFAGWVRALVLERQLLAAEHDRVQAELLAVSAIDRARARLLSDAAYQGETWQVTGTSDGPGAGGAVEIRVESVDGQPQSRRIRVDAQFPERGAHTVRERHEETMTVPIRSEAS